MKNSNNNNKFSESELLRKKESELIKQLKDKSTSRLEQERIRREIRRRDIGD